MALSSDSWKDKILAELDGLSGSVQAGAEFMETEMKASMDAVSPAADNDDAERYAKDVRIAMCKGMIQALFSEDNPFRTAYIKAICQGNINEITDNLETHTPIDATVGTGINVQVDPVLHTGATTAPGSATQTDAQGTAL